MISYVSFNIYGKNIVLQKKFIELFTNTAVNNDTQLSEDYVRNYFNASNDNVGAHWLRIIKHYLSIPLDNGYGSHQPVLLAASILTGRHGGPILEMGCGYYSTLLLHEIAVKQQNRYLLSSDTDREWLRKFEANMSSSMHQFRHINNVSEWDTININHPRWSMILIDHKPGERRTTDIIRLVNVTDVIIVHDTETATYYYEAGLSLYPYRYHYTYLGTATDIASKSNGTLIQNIRYLLELTVSLKVPRLPST
ncbi:unnamed protein product [Adineta steineri]|uniref:Class I SAM-dependent methyltransferase n=1 Tax=Adineta steineri TaxID=433720 RepID=A0A815E216_9BILA|nr:unnamed protein product [Adineta steineri]